MNNKKALEKFICFYEEFNINNKELFEEVYAKDIVFKDPFHYFQGRENLYQYFVRLMEKVKNCQFSILESIEKNDTAVVIWRMTFNHPAMNKNQPIEVYGASHLKIDEQIYYHRDYFCLAWCRSLFDSGY